MVSKNARRQAAKPAPSSKIDSLPSKLLSNKAQMAMLEQQLDPNDPDFIKKKTYLDWLSKKTRENNRVRRESGKIEAEKAKEKLEKEEMQRAENALARKAWMKRKKPVQNDCKSIIVHFSLSKKVICDYCFFSINFLYHLVFCTFDFSYINFFIRRIISC